jgi:Tfp pilus assembly PilM family ATPase
VFLIIPMFFQKRQFLGLDIGSSSTKAVLFERAGRSLRVLSCQESVHEAEGILNDQELILEIGLWLQENSWREIPACLGIPQYYGSTMLADFPGGSRRAIAKMVAFETRQLAGVSEEGFVHSWQVFPSSFERACPVLITICNAGAINERLQGFKEKAHGNPVSSALNGLAMLNAFIDLEKTAAKSEQPVLLLDLGLTTSTVVIAAAGQALYAGTLSFAAERFNKALDHRQYQFLAGEGLQRLCQLNLADDSERSPMLIAARQLEEEIQQAVEHWRSVEKETLAKTPIEGVYVCGGASRIGTLQNWLEKRLEVPVHIFGPTWNGETRPEFVTAWGLALQAAGKAAVEIDLLPAPLRWEKQRKKRFPLLIAAVALFLLVFSAWQLQQFQSLGRATAAMRKQSSQLSTSGALADELTSLQKQLLSHEEQLLPLLIAGKQTLRLRQALEAMANACGDEDWFIYLGDESSFQPTDGKKQTGPVAAPSQGTSLFATAATATKSASAEPTAVEFPQRLLPGQRTLAHNFISAGYTPFVPAQPYEQVRKIARHLQEQGGFGGVDLLPENVRVTREDLFLPWQQFFRKLPESQFRAFMFKMPLEKNKTEKDEEE